MIVRPLWVRLHTVSEVTHASCPNATAKEDGKYCLVGEHRLSTTFLRCIVARRGGFGHGNRLVDEEKWLLKLHETEAARTSELFMTGFNN